MSRCILNIAQLQSRALHLSHAGQKTTIRPELVSPPGKFGHRSKGIPGRTLAKEGRAPTVEKVGSAPYGGEVRVGALRWKRQGWRAAPTAPRHPILPTANTASPKRQRYDGRLLLHCGDANPPPVAQPRPHICSSVSMPSTSRPCRRTRAVKSHRTRRDSRWAGSALRTGQFS